MANERRSTASKGIHAKLIAVLKDVKALDKDGSFKDKGGRELYQYITKDQVLKVVKVAFVKHKILCIPNVLEAVDNGNRCQVKMETRFIDSDNPSDMISTVSIGYGTDHADKAAGKAQTNAYKIALSNVLMLNAIPDVEDDDVSHDPDEPRVSDTMKQKEIAGEALLDWAHTFRERLDKCNSHEEVEKVRKANARAMNRMPPEAKENFQRQIEERKAELDD